MSALVERVETVVVEEEITGLRCDVCDAVHKYERPPDGYPKDTVVELKPLTVGWERMYLTGSNGNWDLCPGCLPKLRNFFLRPQTGFQGLRIR